MLALLTSLVIASTPHLIPNGNFEQGRKGFSTQYTFSSDTNPEGTCAIGDNPRTFHNGGFIMGDHTTGRGQMLIINGGAMPNDTVWQTKIKIAAGQTYEFTGWAASWSLSMQDGTAMDINPARLQAYIDGKPVGAIYKVDAKSGVWGKFTVTWKSPSTKEIQIKIVNTNTNGIGNDFALDDLAFAIQDKKR